MTPPSSLVERTESLSLSCVVVVVMVVVVVLKEKATHTPEARPRVTPRHAMPRHATLLPSSSVRLFVCPSIDRSIDRSRGGDQALHYITLHCITLHYITLHARRRSSSTRCGASTLARTTRSARAPRRALFLCVVLLTRRLPTGEGGSTDAHVCSAGGKAAGRWRGGEKKKHRSVPSFSRLVSSRLVSSRLSPPRPFSRPAAGSFSAHFWNIFDLVIVMGTDIGLIVKLATGVDSVGSVCTVTRRCTPPPLPTVTHRHRPPRRQARDRRRQRRLGRVRGATLGLETSTAIAIARRGDGSVLVAHEAAPLLRMLRHDDAPAEGCLVPRMMSSLSLSTSSLDTSTQLGRASCAPRSRSRSFDRSMGTNGHL